MNGYLVQLRGMKEEIPVSWHEDRKEAFDAAEALTDIPDGLAARFGVQQPEAVMPKIVVFHSGEPVQVIELVACAKWHTSPDGES